MMIVVINGLNGISFSMMWSIIGLLAIGKSALGLFKVRGQSLLAYPPARIITINLGSLRRYTNASISINTFPFKKPSFVKNHGYRK